jgi:hypothetical protein
MSFAAALLLGGLGYQRHARAQNNRPFIRMGGPPVPASALQIAVSGDRLFVLRGNSLLRLNATTLAVEARTEIPERKIADRTRDVGPVLPEDDPLAFPDDAFPQGSPD